MQTKICTRCKQEQPLTEFYKDKRLKKGRISACRTCINTYKKNYYRSEKGQKTVQDYKEKNRERISQYNKTYLRKYRSFGFKNQKKLEYCLYKGGRCEICGFEANQDTIAAFDFHHLNPEEKEFTPSDMLMLKKEKVLKELDKCQLLCSNCHRILHHRQYRAKLVEQREGVETK